MQLHLYVPDEVAELVRRKAEVAGLSLSRYLAVLVERDVSSGWPEGFFERVVGRWQGPPLERPAHGKLERREDL